MADEKSQENGRLGSFQLGRRYKDGNMEAELGRLYEAYHVDTGNAAMVLLPSPAWESEEAWEVRASSRAEPPHMVLEVVRAPASGKLRALSRMLDVMAAALKRVEDNAQARTHLLEGRWGLLLHRARCAYRWLSSWEGLAVAGLAVLALGVGHWLLLPGRGQAPSSTTPAHGVAQGALPYVDAPMLIDKPASGMEVLAYPLPDRPFRNQAKAPCKPREGEVEISGGCWVEVAKKPPCFENHAEYQGKCYLPVSLRSREPQAVQP
ncbi:hypothetical protein [Archangium lansingense]|uniref:Protein kinase n=1 Tax=Archangium lansingense TaxID=2995310 RepID=A0ABT4AK93_9BACT|nr:hypothetical protein [Archangium lansinium]MCY1081262.1 hypothetical protein [Archangium lansinium]